MQEACAKFVAVHILKFEILQTTWKSKTKNHQNNKSIGEKLKTKGLMFFASIFSCDLQDFKFWYVNQKAFGAGFFYWADFNFKIDWTPLCQKKAFNDTSSLLCDVGCSLMSLTIKVERVHNSCQIGLLSMFVARTLCSQWSKSESILHKMWLGIKQMSFQIGIKF